MPDSLKDILNNRKNNEPPEIAVIKDFVFKSFNVVPGVALSANQIVIEVPNAALAGSLRMKIYELQKLVNSPKRLVIRIC